MVACKTAKTEHEDSYSKVFYSWAKINSKGKIEHVKVIFISSVIQLMGIFQAEGEPAVLVAGDPEREHMRKVKQDGGIRYHVNILHALVSVLIEIETEIYKVISNSQKKQCWLRIFSKKRIFPRNCLVSSLMEWRYISAHTKILTYYMDVAKLKSGAPSLLNNEIQLKQ